MSHSWGLTVPPKLVHGKPQDPRLGALGEATSMQRDTHCTHMHGDTPVLRDRDQGRNTGVTAGQRERGMPQQCH